VTLDSHHNGDVVAPGDVTAHGKHRGAKGIYWIAGVKGDQYWPKRRINLRVDGTWRETYGIGTHAGPRETILGLVWVDDLINDVFGDVVKRSKVANYWEPITFKPSGK
jgi:hypothetical protein